MLTFEKYANNAAIEYSHKTNIWYAYLLICRYSCCTDNPISK